jgi:hypothetical protein
MIPKQSLKGKKPITKPMEHIKRDMDVTPKHFTLITQLSEPEIEPLHPISKYSKVLINSQVPFPRWDQIYKIFREEDCPDIVPLSGPKKRNVDDLVVTNIIRSHLHTTALINQIMSCLETIEWVIKHTDIDNITVINDEDICVAYYQEIDLEKHYRLH